MYELSEKNTTGCTPEYCVKPDNSPDIESQLKDAASSEQEITIINNALSQDKDKKETPVSPGKEQ